MENISLAYAKLPVWYLFIVPYVHIYILGKQLVSTVHYVATYYPMMTLYVEKVEKLVFLLHCLCIDENKRHEKYDLTCIIYINNQPKYYWLGLHSMDKVLTTTMGWGLPRIYWLVKYMYIKKTWFDFPESTK